jgi:DNA-binding HxlR family transcriptional regulator
VWKQDLQERVVLSPPTRAVLHLTGVSKILSLINKNSEMRFSEIMKEVRVGNPSLKNAAALSYRLRGLEKSGLVKKRTENNLGEPVKIFYYLTNEGCAAVLHLRELDEIMHKASQCVKETHI